MQQPLVMLDLRKTRSGKSLDYRDAIVFVARCFKIFPSGLKSVSEKFRFLDGLVWIRVGLTTELKLCFQISPE